MGGGPIGGKGVLSTHVEMVPDEGRGWGMTDCALHARGGGPTS